MNQSFRLFIILIFGASNIFAQEVTTYTTFDGSKFTEKDSITIGYPSGYNSSYKSIKEYYYEGQYSNGYREVKINLNSIKIPIINIYRSSEVFYNDKVIVKVGEKGLLKPKYHIDIETAVQNGEVIVKSNTKTSLISTFMSENLAFTNFHKLHGNTARADREEYLFRFQNDLYDKTHEDEFQFQSALKSAEKELTQLALTADTSTIYSIGTSVNLQKYDFDNEGFPINEKEISFKLLSPVSRIWNNSNRDLKPIYLALDNFKNFTFLTISPESSESFITRRKDKYGNVDRKVFIKIFYKLKATNETEELKSLSGNVIKIEVYEFESFQGNFLGEIYDLTK